MSQQQPPTKQDTNSQENIQQAKEKGTYAEKTARIQTWVQAIRSVVPIIWIVVILVVIIPLIGKFFIAGSFSDSTDPTGKGGNEQVTVVQPDWSQVDEAMAQALTNARNDAEQYASEELDVWVDELISRVDNSFLDWYFNYFSQKQREFNSFFVYISSGAINIINNHSSTPEERVSEVITEDFQTEFARRVLRPKIAQFRLERLAQQTVDRYLANLINNINNIKGEYQIPEADWERYLSDINDTKGNTSSLSLKVLAGSGGYIAAKPLVTPLIGKVGSKVVAKMSGKAGAKVATKAGATLAGKIGAELLDPLVGIGIIIWDVWDYYNGVQVDRPILHDNIADYLQEVKFSLLENPESGIMTAITQIENKILQSI